MTRYKQLISRDFEAKPGTEESLATTGELTALAEQIKATNRVQTTNVAYRVILFFLKKQNRPVSRKDLLNELGYKGSIADIKKEFDIIFAKLAEKGITTDIRLHVCEEDRLKHSNKGRAGMMWNRVALYHVPQKPSVE